MLINNNDDIKKYYIYFEIININIFKNIFESLSGNIDIARLILIKNKNISELEITSTNSRRTIYFKSRFNDNLIRNVLLPNEKVEKVEIEFIPIDLVNILKSYDTKDERLLLYIYNNDEKNMTVEFKNLDSYSDSDSDSDSDTDLDSDTKSQKKIKIIKKSKKNKIKKNNKKEKKFKLDIRYPLISDKEMLTINFEKKISMNINYFNKICKDLDGLFKSVKISSKNNKTLYFSYSDKCDGLIKLNYDKTNVILDNIIKLKNNNISSIYCIEDIIGFNKLSNITTDYYFMIKNNNFLESTYIINNYGRINIRFSPLKEDIIKDSVSNSYIDKSDNLSNLSNLSDNEILDDEKKIKKNKKTINDKIIYIEIEKIELFKNICECIEKIVSEPIFKINTINEEMEIKIVCCSNSKNINLNINVKNIFGRYKQLENIINLGIGLKNLNEILKTTEKTDIIILSIDPEDKHNLNIQIKNKDKEEIKLRRIYKIRLLNVEDTELSLTINQSPNHKYKINIESNEFYKICKDINSVGEEFKISYDDKNLIFSSMSECKYANIIKKDNNLIDIENTDYDNKIKNKILNEFEIKDIMFFNKLSSFMENFNINLSSDGRFIIRSNFSESSGSIVIQYLSKNICDIIPNDKNIIKSDVETMDDKLIFFKLKKISFMKNIIDTLDKMITDVEWIFTSKKNIESKNLLSDNEKTFVGLEITCTDISKTLYVKTKLTDELFKSYYCDKSIFKFGMNLEYYNKILKLTDKNDIAIYCYIEKNDPSNLVIRFKNTKKKNKKIFKIPLQIINIKKDNIIRTLEFEKKINLKPESLFSKCKMINNNSLFVKIQCDNEKLLLKCVGDKEGLLTLDSTDDSTLKIINLDKNIIESAYEIKNILLFNRLCSITEEFSIYMKNNFALTSIYNFGDYGNLSVILSPSTEEHINNKLYDYSDDEEDDIELLHTNTNLMELY